MRPAALLSAAATALLLSGQSALAHCAPAYPDYWRGGPPLPPLCGSPESALGHGTPRAAVPQGAIAGNPTLAVPVPERYTTAEFPVDTLIPRFGSAGVVTSVPQKGAVYQDPWYSPGTYPVARSDE